MTVYIRCVGGLAGTAVQRMKLVAYPSHALAAWLVQRTERNP